MISPNFSYTIESLKTEHNRSQFSCGLDILDRYLRQQAGQDLRRRVATPFVLQDLDNNSIAGYYSASRWCVYQSKIYRIVKNLDP